MSASLKILHLFPRLLGLNGESGNVDILRLRSEWRGLPVEITRHDGGASAGFGEADLVFIGSGPTSAQLLAHPLVLDVAAELRELAADGRPFLAIGAGFQLLGQTIALEGGDVLEGAGVFPVATRHGGTRVVGDFVVESPRLGTVVGFENRGSFVDVGPHGTLGRVVYGRGNTETPFEEGFWEDNLLGTHMHGPILANNPGLADSLLDTARTRRGLSYTDPAPERLREIDDRAREARGTIAAAPLSE
ncbi:glutamine amidotransferase [Herbiconiux sp. CPCC 203407]|uniref:Lipid II isoglutaminyl synthase (glutamine-hydrolyzing) subunit GatD n=1 Tax=Herbiconiux oxytropis TaxID=2970915 RepID=A0AA41XD65_9MICO|nr:glutamine amidotransferase [Herbiconiux oxytropis]MCS5720481.1 glutamine amidotransferase [Herbiconiux oxytropis]MCS5726054.1 glutamine amidotransferase [Herbiconiux oxytropis]